MQPVCAKVSNGPPFIDSIYDVPVFGGSAVHGAVKTAGGHTGPGNGGTAPPHPAQRHKNI